MADYKLLINGELCEAAEGEVRYHAARDRVLEVFERRYFQDLAANAESLSAAARRAGLDRKSLRAKLKKFGITLAGSPDEPTDSVG